MKAHASPRSCVPTSHDGTSLVVGIDGGPGPVIAVAELAPMFFGDVPGLGMDERPDLVTLDPADGQVADGPVLIDTKHR
jgi:hypothetical protein